MRGWNKRLHKLSLLVIFSILTFSFFNIFFNVEICIASDGNTLYVGGTEIGNYTTIQDAIDNSMDDDTVYVYDGIYYENLFINKPISLVGIDKNFTIIDGNRSLYTILIKFSWVNITGFTIQNGEMGIYVPGADYSFNNISGNIFLSNFEGIRLYNSSNNKITQNTFKDHDNYGIILYESESNVITVNTFPDNYKGIFLGRWSNNNVIYGNNITKNVFGVNLDYSFKNMICMNWITYNEYGVFLSYSNDNNVTDNFIEFNDVCGICLSSSDDNTISPNTYLNNYQDVKEEPKPPAVKAPGFEILFAICAVLVVLLLRMKELIS